MAAPALDPKRTLSTPDHVMRRVRQLGHRWLPLLLRRVGVSNRCAELVRDTDIADEEFMVRLKVVRDAALLSAATAWSRQDRQLAELADAAAAIAGQLALGLELRGQDADAAERCVERAGEQLVGLMVVGSPGTGDGPAGPAIAPVDRPVSLWSRVRQWMSAKRAS